MNNNVEAYYGLPKEVKYCKHCVISNQRPSSSLEFRHTVKSKKHTINFDEEGICDACRVSELKEKIDWKKREKELKRLCDKYRRTEGRYDCIVPGSGGKDSTMAAWLLKYKYNMNPLTVTWAPHLFTPYGWRNFRAWTQKGGFDNILFTPNGKVHRLLTRLAFVNLLHPFQPFILGQKNIGAKFALKYDVPLVFYGENEAEYGNPKKDVLSSLREKKFHLHGDYMNLFLGGVQVRELIKKYGLTMTDLDPYLPLDPDSANNKEINVHYVGYYEKWDPQEAYYFAVEKIGFQPNDQRTEGTYSKYNSIDDKTDPYHYWTTLIKFGIGRATYDASQEIRNKKITRDEGIALVKKFDSEFPKRYFKEFLEYLDMSKDEFFETADKFRSPHLWKKEKGEWKLRHPIWETEK
ncbi:N-acetyl sugar amidotransferase [Candidatus Woesearchaeota archaeon]|nr:N-acetyl sugar amidotransferase [Candidatus Woesearchaeota archaeon]